MKDKSMSRILGEAVYYKHVYIHLFCDFYLRCERQNKETSWYFVHKNEPSSHRIKITRENANRMYNEQMELWYELV